MNKLGWLLIWVAVMGVQVVKAESFPTQPIRLIVTTGPGTGSDTIARLLEQKMGKQLGVAVVVENRPGAGGVLGMDAVARAKPDGHTLVVGANGTMIAIPAMKPKEVRYRLSDFSPVMGLVSAPFVVVTANTEAAPKTLEELIARTKKTPPSYGSSGVGTITHLASEMLLRQTNSKAVHVPYKGSNQSLADVIGGSLLFATDTVPAVLPLIKGGKLRALAVTSGSRVKSLPDVPTAVESGYKDMVATAWWGLLAPANTPESAVSKLEEATISALQDSEVKSRLEAMDLEVMAKRPAEFDAFIKTETEAWTKLIHDANLQAE